MLTHTSSILKSKKVIKYNSFFIKNFIQEANNLASRLFIQAYRRPSHIISGLIQPILWLILFGALFKNIPLNLFHFQHKYTQFLSCGILPFTCFTGSLNAGLPLIFDREFGFFNRLLVIPLRSRSTIVFSSIFFIICITLLQSFIMLILSLDSFINVLNIYKIQLIVSINILLTIIISSLSIGLAFILPGHIEFLACILIINLPTLFTSTALAPTYLMPYWLQIITKFNILTYAIEALRFITANNFYHSYIIEVFNLYFDLKTIFILLILLSLFSITSTTYIINKKLEE